MSALPTGTVTFLFIDIEGSTSLLQRVGDTRGAGIFEEHHGDGFQYRFSSAKAVVQAAVAAQRAVLAHAWPDGAAVRVRMGLHSGEPVAGLTGIVGIDIHRATRICTAG